MALVKCAECSREISDKAAACPGCGAPIASMSPVPECNASTKRVVGGPVASCAVCRTEVPVGSRWCPICRTNVIDAIVGRLATPGSRIEAYVIDVAILIALFLLSIIVKGMGPLLFLVYAVVYLIALAHGVTPGKHMVGIHVVKESGETAGFGTMLLRETIGKIVSGMIFSLGYIWVLIDKDRQAWHDSSRALTFAAARHPPEPPSQRSPRAAAVGTFVTAFRPAWTPAPSVPTPTPSARFPRSRGASGASTALGRSESARRPVRIAGRPRGVRRSEISWARRQSP